MRTGTIVALLFTGGLVAAGLLLHQTEAVVVLLATFVIVLVGRREARIAALDPRGAATAGNASPAPVEAGASLVAIVCPDEVELLPQLLVAATTQPRGLVVLAIDGTEPRADRRRLPIDANEMLRDDAKLRTCVADAAARAGRPAVFLTAAGTDPALVTLEVARIIRAAEVFTVCHDADDAVEGERRATRSWASLARPKQPLNVHLVHPVEPMRHHVFALGPGDTITQTAGGPVRSSA